MSNHDDALQLAVQCGILKRTPNGSMPAARFSIDEVESFYAAAQAAALEMAAKRCEARAEERFEEHGIREGDTGATYYAGTQAEWYEAQDEEDENVGAMLRQLAKEITDAK